MTKVKKNLGPLQQKGDGRFMRRRSRRRQKRRKSRGLDEEGNRESRELSSAGPCTILGHAVIALH